MGRKRIVILSDLVHCILCGKPLVYRESSFFHAPDALCPWVDSSFPETKLNDALWLQLSERLVLTPQQKESIVALALSKAPGAGIHVDPERAMERLGAVVEMMKHYSTIDPREVNAALRGILEQVLVNDKGELTLVPRAWCAGLFSTTSSDAE